MRDWPRVKIGDVAEVFDGPHATPKTVDSGPIFLGIGALQNGRIRLDETKHVTAEDFKTWTRRVEPQRNDVVFSYETRIGEAAIIPDGLKCCLGRRMGLVRANQSRLDPRFFLYTYLSPAFQAYLKSKTITGATVERIALKEFPGFLIPLPTIAEQTAIASILAALDDKIELNRRMNETLEQMAQAIFKDWFVDFGPVRRKQQGATDPVAVLGGLVNDLCEAETLSALFPNDLGAGALPEGWTMSDLGSQFDIKIGRTPPRKEQQHFTGANGVPWMSIRDLGECGTFIHNTSEGLTYDAAERFRVPMIEAGTVVVSFKLTIGRVAIAERDMLSNEAIAQLARKNGSPPASFMYCMLTQYDYGKLGSTSSIASAVNSASIRSIQFVVPSKKVLAAFDRVARPLFDLIKSRGAESRTLAETRDYLLPKLMSGEVRVREVEAKAEMMAVESL